MPNICKESLKCRVNFTHFNLHLLKICVNKQETLEFWNWFMEISFRYSWGQKNNAKITKYDNETFVTRLVAWLLGNSIIDRLTTFTYHHIDQINELIYIQKYPSTAMLISAINFQRRFKHSTVFEKCKGVQKRIPDFAKGLFTLIQKWKQKQRSFQMGSWRIQFSICFPKLCNLIWLIESI